MNHYHVVIVGAGFAGLCMGIKLKSADIHDFIILEKADDLGGTWRDNTYPGAECDIPSALYSYSFEHNANWRYKWSEQAQILKYQRDTAHKYQLQEHLLYQQVVIGASFNQIDCIWQVETQAGERFTANNLVCGVGQLHIPKFPDIAGQSDFAGLSFHSAEWRHDVDFNKKRVAVIGNAASAVQFVPKIAPLVKQLTIYQRSANWMLPKMDRPYTRLEQWISEKIPMVTRLYRFSLWLKGELGILPAIRGNRFSRWLLRGMHRRNLKKHVKDPGMRAQLTPGYPLGAKRILFADDYYPALTRDNVELISQPIKQINARGIVLEQGQEDAFDMVIFATGFQTNPFLSSIQIRGIDGRQLSDHWRSGAHAYLGVVTHGFPNFFMLYGPNTNLGHNSIIIMLEAQANYIRQAIQGLQTRAASAMNIRAECEAQYNRNIQYRLSRLAFGKVANSWYMDDGKITNNWVGGTCEYCRRLKRIDWSCYQLISTATQNPRNIHDTDK